MSFPSLETERLQLREITHTDVEALLEVFGNHEHMQWFGIEPMTTIQQMHNIIDIWQSWRESPNPGTRWGIQLKNTSELIGTCGLFKWDKQWKKCVIGYELNQHFCGQGLMQEALTSMISWGYASMQLNRIEAQVHPKNIASQRVLEKLGFQQEGRLREAGYWYESFQDLYQYSLLRADWADL